MADILALPVTAATPKNTIGGPGNEFYPGAVATVISTVTQLPHSLPPVPATAAADAIAIATATLTADLNNRNQQVLSITAVAPGQTVVRVLENGVDGDDADVTVIVTARPGNVVSLDMTTLVLTGN